MSVNRYKPHVYLIPEDDANRQLANGFVQHHAVNERRIAIRSPAGGWRRVLEVLESEYLGLLRKNHHTHVVLLMDFDDDLARPTWCLDQIAEDVRTRVFLLGSRVTPEKLRAEMELGLEQIGEALAEDCSQGVNMHWDHPHLQHNQGEVQRLLATVKPILFQAE